jgi:putative transposase
MSDHIHVVISIPPKLSVATLIGHLKGASSHHINQNYAGGPFLWQAEYGVFRFSESSLFRIVNYVNDQKKHHADQTIRSEMESVILDMLRQ